MTAKKVHNAYLRMETLTRVDVNLDGTAIIVKKVKKNYYLIILYYMTTHSLTHSLNLNL